MEKGEFLDKTPNLEQCFFFPYGMMNAMNNRHFLKILKSCGGGLLLLSSVSLFSLGFGAWNIVTKVEGSVAAKADNVINYNDYFLFNKDAGTIDKGDNWKKAPIPLEYNDYGAVKDGVVGANGTFTFYLACRLRGDNGLYPTDQTLDSFSFDLSISDKGSFTLTQYLATSVSYVVENDQKDSVSLTSSLNGTKTASITCNDSSLLSSSRLFYTITLNFDFSSVLNSFKSSVANNMGNVNLSFSIMVGE